LKIAIAADINGISLARHQNLSCNIRGRLNSSSVNHVTIKSGKQCSSA